MFSLVVFKRRRWQRSRKVSVISALAGSLWSLTFVQSWLCGECSQSRLPLILGMFFSVCGIRGECNLQTGLLSPRTPTVVLPRRALRRDCTSRCMLSFSSLWSSHGVFVLLVFSCFNPLDLVVDALWLLPSQRCTSP